MSQASLTWKSNHDFGPVAEVRGHTAGFPGPPTVAGDLPRLSPLPLANPEFAEMEGCLILMRQQLCITDPNEGCPE